MPAILVLPLFSREASGQHATPLTYDSKGKAGVKGVKVECGMMCSPRLMQDRQERKIPTLPLLQLPACSPRLGFRLRDTEAPGDTNIENISQGGADVSVPRVSERLGVAGGYGAGVWTVAVLISTNRDFLAIEKSLPDFAVGVASRWVGGGMAMAGGVEGKLGGTFVGVVFFFIEDGSGSWLAGRGATEKFG